MMSVGARGARTSAFLLALKNIVVPLASETPAIFSFVPAITQSIWEDSTFIPVQDFGWMDPCYTHTSVSHLYRMLLPPLQCHD